jgi:O-antigen biosynthesis protein
LPRLSSLFVRIADFAYRNGGQEYVEIYQFVKEYSHHKSIMLTTNLVSIIVPCFNTLRFTKMCINSIIKYTTYPYELIVIDNGSTDGTCKYLNKLKKRLIISNKRSLRAFKPVINNRNLGVSAALNHGIGISKGQYVCYLNNDVIVTVEWLEGLIKCAESDERIGIVGCSTNMAKNSAGLFPKTAGLRNIKEIQKTAAAISILRRGQYEKAHFIYGFCMLIKRCIIDKIGLFDESFYPCGGDDLDYSIRVKKAGYWLINAGDVFIFHFFSKATKSAKFSSKYNGIDSITESAKAIFLKKWGQEGKRFYRLMKDC